MGKRKDYYMHQQFLMNVDIGSISLPILETSTDDFHFVQDFTVSRNLFDFDEKLVRKVSLSYLLKEIDTLSDWYFFVEAIKYVDVLMIDVDIFPCQLPVVQKYYEDSIKSLVVLLSEYSDATIRFIEKRAVNSSAI